MASFNSGGAHPDGQRADFSGQRPKVNLPAERPTVNLPGNRPPTSQSPAYSQWATPQPNSYLNHTVATEPSVMTLDSSFSVGGPQTPQVNLPLESQLRGLILNHEAPQEATGSHPNQNLPRRPNQTQRRRHEIHSNGAIFPGHTFQPNAPQALPPLRGLTYRYNPQLGFNRPNQGSFSQNQTNVLPSARYRQLYDPNINGLQPRQSQQLHGGTPRIGVQEQADYLDALALREIPRVELSMPEFTEKQALRLSLEEICRKTVVDYYQATKGPSVVAESVELKCFGSLSTTFATKSSDMDLVLVYPIPSEPDIPRHIEKALLDLGYGARLLSRTRVPIIRFCEKPTTKLANLLLEERLKWEKERDANPEPRKPEKKPKHMDTVSGVPEPTLPQNPPDDNQVKGDAKVKRPPKSEGRKQIDKKIDSEEGLSKPRADKKGTDPRQLMHSDEELTRLFKLAMYEGWYEPGERMIINAFIQTVEMKNTPDAQKWTARARLQELPDIIGRYRPPQEADPLDFPKDGVGIQCDINFSNHLALHNSHLLKCYSLCDPRVRRMVLFVKAWSKKRKINSPYHGTLSSYGYVLMVLHYLVNIASPPVVPNLQRIPQAFEDELSSREVLLDGHDIRFFRNEAAIEDLRHRRAITINEESLGSLLRGFFHYFAQQGYTSPDGGFQWTHDTLSLRTVGGILPKHSKGWTSAKTEKVEMGGPGPAQMKEIRQRYLFAIEDPFEIEHNIARTVVHKGIVAIRDEFRRAHRLIEIAGTIPGMGTEDLFAEAEDKEKLQHRAFGPRPRRDHGPVKEAEKKGDGNTDNGNGEPAPMVSAKSIGSQPMVQQQK